MWFWFAILSAVVSAVSVILNKKALKNINTTLVSWALFAFSIPFLIYPSFKDGFPKINLAFLIATALSVIVFGYAKTLSLRSLRGSVLSEVAPLAFFSVFVQYILGLIFLGERLRLLPFFGLILIVTGGYLLKVTEAKTGFLNPFKVILKNKDSYYYLLAMLMMPFTSLFDKIGLLNIQPTNQSFLLLWENFLTTILLTGYMAKKDKNWFSDVRKNFWTLSLNGIVYTILSLSWLFGITTGALALVSGVKKFEVLFVLLLSWLLFGDKPKKSVWFGTTIMLIGVLLTRFG